MLATATLRNTAPATGYHPSSAIRESECCTQGVASGTDTTERGTQHYHDFKRNIKTEFVIGMQGWVPYSETRRQELGWGQENCPLSWQWVKGMYWNMKYRTSKCKKKGHKNYCNSRPTYRLKRGHGWTKGWVGFRQEVAEMQIINNGVTASSDGRMQVEGTDTRVKNEQAKKWEAF